MPGKRTLLNAFVGPNNTMLPEGIETVPRRFAVSQRNKWMIAHSDYVVTYVTHSFGGAAQFAELAARKKKHIITIKPKEAL